MAIKFACPHCGKRFTAKDEQAGKRAKCSACGEVTRIPSQPTREADDSPTPPPVPPAAPPADGEKRRPLWKDPVVVIGMAAPTLILAVFFTSLAWLHFRASRSGAGARRVVIADRPINPVGPEQPLLTNQQGPPPARGQDPKKVQPVHADDAAKSRIGAAPRTSKLPTTIPPITPPPIEDSLVKRWAAETGKLMHDYQPEMISVDNQDLHRGSGAMPWPIRVPMQGRVPNFPVGIEGIVHVGDDQFNKDRRLSESGVVDDGSIVLLIPDNGHDPRYAIYHEASRLYGRSIEAGDPVGINMVIASGFAVRVKTGTRVRVVKFDGGGWGSLPRDGRMSRDVEILDGEGRGVIVSIPALYLEPAP